MRIDWDVNADALYVRFSDGAVDHQEDNFPVILDLGRSGELIGIEVLSPLDSRIVRQTLESHGVDAVMTDVVGATVALANLSSLSKGRESVQIIEFASDSKDEVLRGGNFASSMQ